MKSVPIVTPEKTPYPLPQCPAPQHAYLSKPRSITSMASGEAGLEKGREPQNGSADEGPCPQWSGGPSSISGPTK